MTRKTVRGWRGVASFLVVGGALLAGVGAAEGPQLEPGVDAPRAGLESLVEVLALGAGVDLVAGRDDEGLLRLLVLDRNRGSRVMLREELGLDRPIRGDGSIDLQAFPVSPGGALRAAVFLHTWDDTARLAETTGTLVELFTFEGGQLVSRTEPVLIGHRSIYRDPDEPTGGWAYRSSGSFDFEPTAAITPATVAAGRLLVRDVDGDGFQDLVIWTRHCRSAAAGAAGRETDPVCGPGFERQPDSLTEMVFDPEEKRFAAPEPSALEVPPEEAWRQAPGDSDLSKVMEE